MSEQQKASPIRRDLIVIGGTWKEKTPPWSFKALHVKDKLGRRRRRRSKSSKDERKECMPLQLISNEERFRNPNFRYERLWVPKVVSL